MYPLLETIKCRDGKLFNLKWHNKRFNEARKLLFGLHNPISLERVIKIPDEYQDGLYRCRVKYAPEIKSVEFIPHQLRNINSLKLVVANDIEYSYKFADRQVLDTLFALRGKCDDILIVKNGLITDSYTANSVFFDGTGWFTPNSVLLPGTQRARLLAEKKVKTREITIHNLSEFQKAGLINAFWNLRNMPIIGIENVIPFPV